MEEFRQTVDVCNLTPLAFSGDKFTWTNRNFNGLLVKERLDRGFINQKWKELFNENHISHLEYFSSDHRMIEYFVSLHAQDRPASTMHKRFRFEQFWLKDSECWDVIIKNWSNPSTDGSMFHLLQNIFACSEAVQHWHFGKYGQMKNDINNAHQRVASLHNSRHSSTAHTTQMLDAKKILDDLLEKEELYWQQRARVDWLKGGDANTKFFHSRAKARYNNNKIKSLLSSDGRILRSEADFAAEASSFFSNLFTTAGEDGDALDIVISTINTSITDEMNLILTQNFTRSDVEEALNSMAPDKSPGMDGMSAMFFQKHWDVVGSLVTNCVLAILNEGADMSEINSALITLIPKVEQPQQLSDYKPISLCSVLYKLVSKAIVNRFKKVLPAAISQNQSAFLPGRLITDNVLLAFELVHCLKNKKRGLSTLLQMEERLGNLKGLSISRGAPSVSHLLFADDSLLFCEANESSCQAIMRILEVYHRASGQLLNTEKTVMSFSLNTCDALKTRFNSVLGMPICDLHEKYLGLPSYAGRDKSKLFSNIKDRVWKLMNSWHAKLFSIGGREVLLKAVVQSIPTYAMSCFSFPKKFCRQLESKMANFWWGSSANKSKIHWKKWSLLCQPKAEGGIGFCSFLHINQALLAKQAWRILEDPHSLLARVLKARYFKNGEFLTASKGTLPSLTWQSICDGRDLLVKGLRWKIGFGNLVKCVSDPWLPGNTTFLPYTYCGDLEFTVEHYISSDRQWDFSLLQQHFGQIDIDRILSLSLSPYQREDKLIWHHSENGSYTVKSGYHLAENLEKMNDSSTSNTIRSWWNRLWALNLPKKVKIFSWRVINDALPTAVNLMHRKISPSTACSLCNCPRESSGHALFLCTRAKQEIHGTKPKPAAIICSFAEAYVQQFINSTLKPASQEADCPSQLEASTSNSHPAHHTRSVPVHWTPPPAGSFKMNVDAAFDEAGRIIGVGEVILIILVMFWELFRSLSG
uniref:Reverse transcriptase zinc-binding domain-containing protein n=1 Tax=Cannabis sativa TaxID=3483 RepID=A0A803Q7D4_CANSA